MGTVYVMFSVALYFKLYHGNTRVCGSIMIDR